MDSSALRTLATPAEQATRALAVAAVAGLAGLGLAWELWLAPTGRGTLVLKVLPLLLPLSGLMKWRLYTFRWTSLLVWAYVAEGLVRATSTAGITVPLAWGEVALAALAFIACAAHVRQRLTSPGAVRAG